MLNTLFTQEMLKRGFLACKGLSLSYAHKRKHIEEYLKNVDSVFKIIRKAVRHGNARNLVEGPVAHTGFRRLT